MDGRISVKTPRSDPETQAEQGQAATRRTTKITTLNNKNSNVALGRLEEIGLKHAKFEL